MNETACGNYTLNSQTYTTSGTYTQTLTNAAGCDSTITLNLAINPNPFPTISANGPTTFCQGGSVLLTPTNIVGTATYSWSNSAITQSITVSTDGNYSVTVTDANGCTGNSAATAVTVNNNPATPAIAQSGNTLACSVVGMSNYEWKLNGTNLPACNSQFCSCDQNGFYIVSITDANGCTAISSPFQASGCNVGIEKNRPKPAISIYPNPFDGKFTLSVSSSDLLGIKLEIFNILGEKVHQLIIKSSNQLIDLSYVPKGIYLVKVLSEEKIFMQKIVHQ